jgi:hypothetical protein
MRYIIILIFISVNIVLSQVSGEMRELRRRIPLGPGGEIFIETYKGNVTVTGWDREEAEIYAEVYVDIEADVDGMEILSMEDAGVRISSFENSIYIRSGKIRVRQDILGLFEVTHTYNPYVSYRIKMPRRAKLIIDDYKSKIRINDLISDVEINTYKGRVDISNHAGSVDIETYKGNVHVEFAKISGSSMFETYKGKIRVGIPGGDRFNLKCILGRRATLHSDFDLKVGVDGEYDWERRYSASINGGGDLIYIESQRGRIFIYER